MAKKKGKFIVIEGGDGSGKTTFINFLKTKHPKYVYCKQPGGNGIGISQKIRELVLSDEAQNAHSLTMFNLFWASRAETIADLIQSSLDEGKIVISDRFDASTYAFQISENPKLEKLFWIVRDVCLQKINPIYMNFKISVAAANSRMDKRNEKNHYDTRDKRYKEKVHSFYKKFFNNKKIKSVTVNADVTKDEMLSSAYTIFQEILKK